MALVELKRDPSPREVRQFAALWLPAAFALIGAMVWYSTGSLGTAVVLWSTGLCLAVAGLVSPPLGYALFVGWMYLTYPLGWTFSHLLLGVIYFGVMTPIGLFLRAIGRNPLRLDVDRAADSYWIERPAADDVEGYFRRF